MENKKFTEIHFRKIPVKLYQCVKAAATLKKMTTKDWILKCWRDELRRTHPEWFKKKTK